MHQEERAAIPPALARDMLGIPPYDEGSVAAGAHVVARTFLSGLAAELQTVVPPTTGGTDRVKEFDERFFGMDIEAALNKITELNHEAFAQGLRESTQATYEPGVQLRVLLWEIRFSAVPHVREDVDCFCRLVGSAGYSWINQQLPVGHSVKAHRMRSPVG